MLGSGTVNPPPARSRLQRWLLLPALLLFSGIMLFCAIPNELSPRALHATKNKMHRSLLDARFRPYAFVFKGRRGEWKRRSMVLAIHGREPDGTLRLLTAAPTRRMQGYRWFQPAEEVLLVKKFQLGGGNRLIHTVDEVGRQVLVRRLQRSRYLRQIARFGCASTYAGAGEVDRVYLSVAYDAINYETGEIRDFAHVVHIRDCRRGRTLRSSRWPAATVGDDGVPRPTPGTADPLMVSRSTAPGNQVRWRIPPSPGDAGGRTTRRDGARPLPQKPGVRRDGEASSSAERQAPVEIGSHGPTRAKARRLEDRE